MRQITVFDRAGNLVSQVGEPGIYRNAALSPDGSRVAVLRQDRRTGFEAVWTFDVVTGKGVAVTSDDFPKYFSRWSPDGDHVTYNSQRENASWGVHQKAWNGEGSEELLFRHAPGVPIEAFNFPANGRFLAFVSGRVLLVAPLTGTEPLARQAIELSREEFATFQPTFSPDSQFLAYISDESGRAELYVRSFDATSGTALAEGKWQITRHGPPLASLAWRRDGKEIFYVTRANPPTMGVAVMSVEVTAAPAFRAGEPRMLFTMPGPPNASQLTHDGQRFVALVPVPAPAAPVP